MNYTITSIDTATGNVTVAFSVDGEPQVIAGLPVNDAAALAQALSDYAVAYQAGLDAVKVTVDPAIPTGTAQPVQTQGA